MTSSEDAENFEYLARLEAVREAAQDLKDGRTYGEIAAEYGQEIARAAREAVAVAR